MLKCIVMQMRKANREKGYYSLSHVPPHSTAYRLSRILIFSKSFPNIAPNNFERKIPSDDSSKIIPRGSTKTRTPASGPPHSLELWKPFGQLMARKLKELGCKGLSRAYSLSEF